MSLKKIAASTPWRRTGCRVISVTRSGSRQDVEHRDALTQLAVLRQRAAGLPHEPDGGVRHVLPARGAHQRAVAKGRVEAGGSGAHRQILPRAWRRPGRQRVMTTTPDQRQGHPDELHPAQPLAQQHPGPHQGRHGVERAQDARHADQAARRGVGEQRVGRDVTEPDQRERGQVPSARAAHRARRDRGHAEDRDTGQPHPPQRVQQRDPRPAVEGEQREPEPDRGETGQQHGPAGDRAGELGAGGQGRTGHGDGHAGPHHGSRPLAPGDPEQDRHHGTQGGDRRDDAHRPGRQRRVEADQPDRAGHSGRERPDRPPVQAGCTLAQDEHGEDDQRARLREADDGRRRHGPRAQPGEEVGGAPQRARGQGQQGQHRGTVSRRAALPGGHPGLRLRWWRVEASRAVPPPSSRRPWWTCAPRGCAPRCGSPRCRHRSGSRPTRWRSPVRWCPPTRTTPSWPRAGSSCCTTRPPRSRGTACGAR